MANKIVDFFAGIGKFLNEVKMELKKVSWSTKEEVKDSTTVVLISIVILGAFIGLFDFIMSKVISMVIK